MSVFADITTGAVLRLSAQLDYLETCQPYFGDITEQAAQFTAPAALVTFEGLEQLPDDPETFDGLGFIGRWTVSIIARSVQGRTEVVQEETRGALDMIADVLVALGGHSLDIGGFSGLRPSGVQLVRAGATEAVYSIGFAAPIALEKED